jgi:AcrR family transcriptional regulator
MYSESVSPRDEPVARLTRKESQEETRRRLVASAIVLFARTGVAATSLNAVAEHAGFSRGAVHGNYSGKDELVAAVAATVVGELGPQLGRILTAPGPSGDRLAAYIRAFLAYCAHHPDAAGALIAVVEHLGREDRNHYGDRAAASLSDLIELFEDGQRRGEMRTFDPGTMAFALRTVLDNAAARLRAPDVDVEALTTEIVALFAAATRKGESA